MALAVGIWFKFFLKLSWFYSFIGPWATISSGCFSSIPSSPQVKPIIEAVEKDYCNILITSASVFQDFKPAKPVLSKVKKALVGKWKLNF